MVQSEITSLITSLKAVGGAGTELLQGELDRLQTEQSEVRKPLKEVIATGAPLAAAVAREFVAGWAAVADLLDAAEPDEARLLVQHFAEAVELAHESADGKASTYVLKVFPEVRPLDPPHDGENGDGPPDPAGASGPR